MEPMIEDARSTDAIEAVDANLGGWLPLFERFDGCRMEEIHGCTRWMSSTPLPMFNGVLGEPKASDVSAAMDEILEPFEADGVPLIWVTRGQDLMNEPLAQRGFEIDRTLAMTMDLSDLVEPPVPDEVEVRRVDDDPAALRMAVEIGLITGGFPAEATDPMLLGMERFPDRDGLLTYLAWMEGVPVAASLLFLGAGVAGIYNVGTLEGYRGRGLGTLVTTAALAAGKAAGYRVAVLQSSEMGESIYRRIGFEGWFDYTFAVRMGGA